MLISHPPIFHHPPPLLLLHPMSPLLPHPPYLLLLHYLISPSFISHSLTGIGFLKEWQRLNVAITRAKYAVWIVGHAETLGTDMEWKHLLDFCKEKRLFSHTKLIFIFPFFFGIIIFLFLCTVQKHMNSRRIMHKLLQSISSFLPVENDY